MENDELIIFDPLGELQKIVAEIEKAKEGSEQHGLRT